MVDRKRAQMRNNNSPRSRRWKRLLTHMRLVAVLVTFCLTAYCSLAMMAPAAMAANDCEWTVTKLQTDRPIIAIWGYSSSDVRAMSNGGEAFDYDGRTWEQKPGGISGILGDIHGTCESGVFAVWYAQATGGSGGILSYYDGSTWNSSCLMHAWGSAWRSVWACSEHDGFVSAAHRVIHNDGDQSGYMSTGFDPDSWPHTLARSAGYQFCA